MTSSIIAATIVMAIIITMFGYANKIGLERNKAVAELKSVAVDNKSSKLYERTAVDISEYKTVNFHFFDPLVSPDGWLKISHDHNFPDQPSTLKLKSDDGKEYKLKDDDIHIYSETKISTKKITKSYCKMQLIWLKVRKQDNNVEETKKKDITNLLNNTNFKQFVLITVFKPDAKWHKVDEM